MKTLREVMEAAENTGLAVATTHSALAFEWIDVQMKKTNRAASNVRKPHHAWLSCLPPKHAQVPTRASMNSRARKRNHRAKHGNLD